MKISSLIKIGAGFILMLFVIIQFVDNEKNIAAAPSGNEIGKHYQVPAHVQKLLKTSCYDCHSNTTVYPWYNNIQPVQWWLADHVNSGKRHFNFDEFNTYSKEKKLHKLDEVVETMQNDEMPLASYTMIHHSAKLSATEKADIEAWVKDLKKEIQ
ncbi:heme-binding domain-containing protein [Chryseobacterium sp. WLY505]|uniref:heme-binding domain-containing protein n=1 Tax=Chryseobacterium sp. WLY505 TaxID=3068892 RepID=UPI002796904D|nr:heme-binding domain-containing protein [Chryseobacterium sp. WLY505]MDQ1857035.1 heme-binding domain-containing protein [Chryseobacterium sp. WLY505]